MRFSGVGEFVQNILIIILNCALTHFMQIQMFLVFSELNPISRTVECNCNLL